MTLLFPLRKKEILNGYEDGTFRPNEQITRAEFAAMLSQFIYGDSTSNGTGYSDITDQDWFYEPVMKLANSGYLTDMRSDDASGRCCHKS